MDSQLLETTVVEESDIETFCDRVCSGEQKERLNVRVSAEKTRSISWLFGHI